MTDLVNDSSSAQSPKRKFSFRFPHLSHHSSSGDKDSPGTASNSQHHKGIGMKTRNFSEESKNVPDLQVRWSFLFVTIAQMRTQRIVLNIFLLDLLKLEDIHNFDNIYGTFLFIFVCFTC